MSIRSTLRNIIGRGGDHTAVVLGASGMVGGFLTRFLLDNPSFRRVVLLVRRSLPVESRKLKQIEVDFAQPGALEEHQRYFRDADVFCCLGTTIKKAGSKDEFERIDYGIPYIVGQIASNADARAVHVITAMGSNPDSKIFYNQVKGRLEKDLSALNLKALHIYRPSLLNGKRLESRPAEEIGNLVAGVFRFAFIGPLKKYRPIAGEDVARCMERIALMGATGRHIYESDRLQEIADADMVETPADQADAD
ncbi:MAG: oxidoreductase [Leptospiraceae bacterium]|nr:oxidoreductase [Leptospiraceae bacterium]